MTGLEFGQYGNSILGFGLIIRLIFLALFRVYKAFSCFLLFDLFQSFVVILIFSGVGKLDWDYRIIWIGSRVISWFLILWTVYSLLASVLKSLPGILKFSNRLLNWVFVLSVATCLLTVLPELKIFDPTGGMGALKQAIIVTFAVERTVTMASFISLFAIFLFFIVWFPVEIPRNLAIFSVGLVVYLGIKASSLLFHTYFPTMSQQTVNGIGLINTSVLAVCFVCWTLLVSRAGQTARVRVGHVWEAREQERLIIQLEAMNNTLLKTRK